eukprot:7382611-Prymnesium_polylepis.1
MLHHRPTVQQLNAAARELSTSVDQLLASITAVAVRTEHVVFTTDGDGCSNEVVYAAAGTTFEMVDANQLRRDELAAHNRGVLEDSGASCLMTGSLHGLIDNRLEVIKGGAGFKTMAGTQQVTLAGIFNRDIVGADDPDQKNSVNFTARWFFKPGLDFDIMGREPMCRVTKTMHGRKLLYIDGAEGERSSIKFQEVDATSIRLCRSPNGLDRLGYTRPAAADGLVACAGAASF